jgi:photosystem II stability/assembly factor-like uncharacterized protein
VTPGGAAAPDARGNLSTWQKLVLPDAVEHVTATEVHPHDSRVLYLSSWEGLYRSADAGEHWDVLTNEQAGRLYIHPRRTDRFYMLGFRGVSYASQDAGRTWDTLPTDFPQCHLALDPVESAHLYAAHCDGGVRESRDGGASWIDPSPAFTETLQALVVSPADARVLVGSTFELTFRSSDGGATWAEIDELGVRYDPMLRFAWRPPGALYLGHTAGLLRSLDGGQTWKRLVDQRTVTVLEIDPDDSRNLVGGGDPGMLHLSGNFIDNWFVDAWPDSPTMIGESAASLSDRRYIYARAGNDVWRVSWPDSIIEMIYVPVAWSDPAAPPPTANGSRQNQLPIP